MSLRQLMAQRRARIEDWQAIGCAPYAYRYDVTHHATELLAKGDAVTEEPGEKVAIAGRLVAKRGQGKASTWQTSLQRRAFEPVDTGHR